MEDWLNSAEIKELRESFSAFQKQQEAEDDAWWDSLDYEGRSQAFRQVCKLMYKAEVQDKGSYRWAIYDVFGLEYGDGLDHFMTLHNLIGKGLDHQESK
jgi:hypothetical protein